ncbi:hypothetical protein ABH15_07500 [Methanoculleus taiwanensis]|uniref:Trypsin-co-occurring domain-containing protein n=1 Tax=Methanoculleus taiwanensis TaxID=1550565 RepID=A0A498GZS8_9EURY|nr:CU044_2847 family protein [Methanoculleus taiwanensis]RXE56032.1 hypothetical protein ABH15_07500 [Methanoculleus taiwanensis]
MSKLIKVKVNGTELWIEADEKAHAESGPRKVSKTTDGIVIGFSEFSEPIKTLCGAIIQTFNDMPEYKKPNKLITEFGLKISGEGNVYLVKTGAEASLVITAEWQV